ncbi:hypothetical protein HYDPIDRAFT_87883 [Hydnomerulius pinastri MD-312]|nr:hypothetical protein HYDPIDRAFT_87883 [Hydnomerulius pinastri MD-312]
MVHQKPVHTLLVIDMQVDFLTESLAVPDGASLAAPVIEIMKLPFDCKYASKDWHPKGHISFASTHDKQTFEKITIYPPKRLVEAQGQDVSSIGDRGLEQVLWPDHCVENTPGAEFADGIREDQFDAIIKKGMDLGVECYSAFKDPWGLLRSNPDLEELLREKKVTDLYVVGVAGDYCVKASAIDAAKLEAFKTWVVREGVRSVSSEGKEWEVMRAAGVGIIDTVDELRAKLVSPA